MAHHGGGGEGHHGGGGGPSPHHGGGGHPEGHTAGPPPTYASAPSPHYGGPGGAPPPYGGPPGGPHGGPSPHHGGPPPHYGGGPPPHHGGPPPPHGHPPHGSPVGVQYGYQPAVAVAIQPAPAVVYAAQPGVVYTDVYVRPGVGPGQQTMTTTVVIAGGRFPHSPCRIECQHCRQNVVTNTMKMTGSGNWLACLGTLFVGCWLGCCLIPFCIDGLKDTIHTCPNCQKMVGRADQVNC